MASKAVRDWFRAEIVTRLPAIPYLDTVNTNPDNKNMPPLWCTLEFNSASETRISLGSRACFREFGEVTIILLGLSGKGDGPLIDAAELAREQFFAIRALLPYGSGGEVGSFVMDSTEPPNHDVSESGNWFLVSLSCAYTFDTVRGS